MLVVLLHPRKERKGGGICGGLNLKCPHRTRGPQLVTLFVEVVEP